MITWMQNNNKYLVVTIWIATIAFIGAGFVGWGSVDFGSKANSVAKVGSVDIPISKYRFAYNNQYAQFSQKMGGKFDKKQAEELGLGKSVLNNLVNEALLLNFAKDNGIITSDKEVGLEIANIPSFKDNSGQFNKDFYNNFLKNRGMKAKDFERILKDELTTKKVLKLLNVKPLALEKEAMSSTFKIADKIKYKVLKLNDVKVEVNEAELKKFWEEHKLNYMSSTKYDLDLLWTESKDVKITDADIESYYKANSFNYTDKDGKVLDLNETKEQVVNDVKLSKIKKQAAVDRSRFKKGKIKATKSVSLKDGDDMLTAKIWEELKSSKEGVTLKPKAVKDRYVTIKVVSIVKPKPMIFEEAKEQAQKDFAKSQQQDKLDSLIKESLKSTTDFNLEPKEFITLSKFQVLPELTPQDSMLVSRAIFGNSKKVDSVKISKGAVVYEVVEQKLLDDSNETNLSSEIATIKNSELSSNLIKELSSKYSTEVYVKDIK